MKDGKMTASVCEKEALKALGPVGLLASQRAVCNLVFCEIAFLKGLTRQNLRGKNDGNSPPFCRRLAGFIARFPITGGCDAS